MWSLRDILCFLCFINSSLSHLPSLYDGRANNPFVPPCPQVSPEFLEALPPAIQEEVLAQQRMEQTRAAMASALPDDPVDPGDFLQTLPPPLRQTVRGGAGEW